MMQPLSEGIREIQARIEQIRNDPNRHHYLMHRTTIEETVKKTQMEEHLRKARSLSMIGERYMGRTFQSFDERPATIHACKRVRFVAEDPTRRGIVLGGQPGHGKTHLVSALAHDCMQRGIPVILDSVPAILRRIRSTFDNEAKMSEAELITRLASAPVLILDDMGKERLTDWSMATLWDIINERYEQNRPIVVTTNLTTSEPHQRFYAAKVPAQDKTMGESFSRRLFEMASDWVDIQGKAPMR